MNLQATYGQNNQKGVTHNLRKIQFMPCKNV